MLGVDWSAGSVGRYFFGAISMNRRSFLTALAALPLVGRLFRPKPKALTADQIAVLQRMYADLLFWRLGVEKLHTPTLGIDYWITPEDSAHA
jgi:hypothetical protein